MDTLIITGDSTVASVRLPVELRVLDGGSIDVTGRVSPTAPNIRLTKIDTINVRGYLDDVPTLLAWTVRNAVEGAPPLSPLRVNVVPVVTSGSSGGWITATLNQDATPATLTLRLAPTSLQGLSVGSQVYAKLSVQADTLRGGSGGVFTTVIRMTIRPRREALIVSTTAINQIVSVADQELEIPIGIRAAAPPAAWTNLRTRIITPGSAPWLRVDWTTSNTIATAPATLIATVSAGLLPPDGTPVEAVIEVSDDDAIAPVLIPIRIRRAPAPVMEIRRGNTRIDTIAVTLRSDSLTLADLMVRNSAPRLVGDTLGQDTDLRNLAVSVSLLTSGVSGTWLRASLRGTRSPAILALSFDKSALRGADTLGVAMARIVVSSSTPGVAPQTLWVAITIGTPAQPVPSVMDWATVSGESGEPLIVGQAGQDSSGSLRFVGWDAAATPWVRVTNNPNGTLTLTPQLQSLPPGEYRSIVTIESASRGTQSVTLIARIVRPLATTTLLRSLRDSEALTPVEQGWVDARGNRNGRLDIGDIAKLLQERR